MEAAGGDVDDRGFPFGDRGGGEVPLGVAEVAGAPGGERAGKPVLAPQPVDGGGSVAAVDEEPVEVAAGTVGATQRLDEYLVAAFGEQPCDDAVRRSATVGGADQHQRRPWIGDGVVAIGQEIHAVTGGDRQIGLHPDARGAHRWQAQNPPQNPAGHAHCGTDSVIDSRWCTAAVVPFSVRMRTPNSCARTMRAASVVAVVIAAASRAAVRWR